ncbi:MAG: bifunctional UDP-N-acetylglucosamine diphosphorylase/glucosamine-1-phosphate N-acetyltransferase GlmU [Actinobacteria bacterium]|nr:bifunctional UDP-N-acetylglucosamine diphosphorylase/glucosamine-1-phosphate N-acetyltransferase GlmU [Actinomycetota bacterium]
MAKTNQNSIAVLILAAGQGVRMKSSKPKVLHDICGKPMICYAIKAAKALNPSEIFVVVGHGGEEVTNEVSKWGVKTIVQEERSGTGHAVKISTPHFKKFDDLLLLYGDMPLIKSADLELLLQDFYAMGSSASVLSTMVKPPSDFGRIIRNSKNEFIEIVEELDATPEQRQIGEVNTGIYCFRTPDLLDVLEEIGNKNAKGEYYITDCVNMCKERGMKVSVMIAPDSTNFIGINSRAQLTQANALMRSEICERLMDSGVTIINPAATYIDDEVEIGQDTVIYPDTYVTGQTRVGSGCTIGPNTFVSDSVIGNRTNIVYSVVKGAEVRDDCNIGPYSHLRPGSVVMKGGKVGSFCEIKKSVIREGAKVPHLSYVGDADIGANANIGAGTITCNYDGFNKHKTVIGEGSFIGSDTMLVAPVKIGKNATTGAGSVISEDVPDGALAIERSDQKNILEWDKIREKKAEERLKKG